MIPEDKFKKLPKLIQKEILNLQHLKDNLEKKVIDLLNEIVAMKKANSNENVNEKTVGIYANKIVDSNKAEEIYLTPDHVITFCLADRANQRNKSKINIEFDETNKKIYLRGIFFKGQMVVIPRASNHIEIEIKEII